MIIILAVQALHSKIMIELPKQPSYIILYDFDKEDPNSKGFIRCCTLEQVHDTITKLAISIIQSQTPNGPNQATYSLQQILHSLKQIPMLKLYKSGAQLGDLKQEQQLVRQYRKYIRNRSVMVQKVYNKYGVEGSMELVNLIKQIQLKNNENIKS